MSRRRARRLATTLTALVLLLAGGYALACALATAPAPTAALTVDADQAFDADDAVPADAVDAQSGIAAVGWLDGEEVWATSDDPVPIASISKLITVLVAQEAQPVAAGEDGPTHVWTDADVARQQAYAAADGVVYPIPAGTEVTARQMLELSLIPSANDFAAAYAYAVFGDNDAFVAAVDDWAARQGLDSISLAEPTGMDEANAASAADLVQVARLALDDPAIAEITAMREATLPWGIGTVTSTNLLHGLVDDVRGLKTGRTNVAGWNLLAAQGGTVRGDAAQEGDGEAARDVVKIAVVLGRDSEEARVSASIALLDAMDGAGETVEVVAEGAEVGTATTVDGREVALVAADGASALLLPGERARAETALDTLPELASGATIPAGADAGVIAVRTPTGNAEVAVVTAEPLAAPDFGWKLAHPLRMLGWA